MPTTSGNQTIVSGRVGVRRAVVIPENRKPKTTWAGGKAIQAAAPCLGIVEPREGQRDQRRHDEHGSRDARNDIRAPRRCVGWMKHQESRLQFRTERHDGSCRPDRWRREPPQ